MSEQAKVMGSTSLSSQHHAHVVTQEQITRIVSMHAFCHTLQSCHKCSRFKVHDPFGKLPGSGKARPPSLIPQPLGGYFWEVTLRLPFAEQRCTMLWQDRSRDPLTIDMLEARAF